jgi:4,5-DOPA dioxygenase extradiol
MNRREFNRTVTALGFMSFNQLEAATSQFKSGNRAPLLFVGHGSPMNAIKVNTYTKKWQELGNTLQKPNAILCISAHWVTFGKTSVSTAVKPETIHDFGGFPEALFQVQYPSPGAPEIAHDLISLVNTPKIEAEPNYGLDHGTWSILKPMYPLANIPVFQLSIDYSRPPQFHFELGQQLLKLREKGVMIIGSGNVVHNLEKLNFRNPSAQPSDWAIEFDTIISEAISASDYKKVVQFRDLGALATLAHPTYDHFLPLMFILGLVQPTDKITYFNSSFDMGTIGMRSMIFS